MKKKGRFDYILLETTGLADPGPIASIFWLDDGLGSEIQLDGMTFTYIAFTNLSGNLPQWFRNKLHIRCWILFLYYFVVQSTKYNLQKIYGVAVCENSINNSALLLQCMMFVFSVFCKE